MRYEVRAPPKLIRHEKRTDPLDKVYTEEINKKFGWVKWTAPYKDPLWAFVEISPSNVFKLTGRKSEFVGQTPEELGKKKYMDDGYAEVAQISDREILLEPKP